MFFLVIFCSSFVMLLYNNSNKIMKTYYISKRTRIDNPFYLVFANVVDEEIVAKTLEDIGYFVSQTSTMIDTADKNYKEHMDVIYKDEYGTVHYVDVKTSGDKYISLSKTLRTGKLHENSELAIIYDDRIYFAHTEDVLKYAKQSKFNDMLYVTIGEFMRESFYVVKIDKHLQEYRKKQLLLKNNLLDETKYCEIEYAMKLCEDALQENYQKTFGETFSIVAI